MEACHRRRRLLFAIHLSWKGRNEARDQAPEASADPIDFPTHLNGPLALPSQGGTSTSSPQLAGAQPLILRMQLSNQPSDMLSEAGSHVKRIF